MIVPRTWIRALVLLVLLTSSAFALAPSTERAIRNIAGALDNLQLDEQLINGPVAENQRQTASNLLRDIDYALKRAAELDRIDQADKEAPEVTALVKRVADLTAKREQLAKNLHASQEAGKALDAQYRAFREDAKPYAKVLLLFPDPTGANQRALAITPDQIAAAIKELGALEQLCKDKYAGIVFNDRLAFQLAIDPVKVCATAANRVSLATGMVKAIVLQDLNSWLKRIVDMKTNLAKNNGLIDLDGAVIHDLAFDREKGKATLLDKQKPFFAVVNLQIPPDLLAPFDEAMDELWAEIDRLAPTFKFPTTGHHDAKAEGGARTALAAFTKGAKVLKSTMLYADWSIAKNFDIPTEKYRTGAILFKTSESKWCKFREFTAHLTYEGGGRYQSKPTFTFGAHRYQVCD